jgi:DNA-directed RNA polymerase subunit E'/Rpb7
MENNIYFNCVLKKKIVVQSKFLNENIDTYIETYLKKKIETSCIDEGYVKKDSVKIIKKSVGMLLGSKFTGDITYIVCYTADVCNPVVGNMMDCKVKFINKLGILGSNGPITITVGRQLHSNDKIFNNIKYNSDIKSYNISVDVIESTSISLFKYLFQILAS